MSKLTQRQWANIERAVLRDGESMNAVAKRYGVGESAVRQKLAKVRTEQVEEVAVQVATAERNMKALKPVDRVRARSLADMYIDLSYTLGEAANIGAKVHLEMIKRAKDIADTTDGSQDDVKMVMALSATANTASKLAVDLMNVGKQTMHDAEKAKDKDKEVMTLAPINIPALKQS